MCDTLVPPGTFLGRHFMMQHGICSNFGSAFSLTFCCCLCCSLFLFLHTEVLASFEHLQPNRCQLLWALNKSMRNFHSVTNLRHRGTDRYHYTLHHYTEWYGSLANACDWLIEWPMGNLKQAVKLSHFLSYLWLCKLHLRFTIPSQWHSV